MRAVLLVVTVISVGHCCGEMFGIELPYSGLLPPKNFYVGKSLRMEGQVKMQPGYFVVNIQKGQTFSPYPTIALHFNPRYTQCNGSIHVNAWHGGNWGTEHNMVLDADLSPGKNFSLAFVFGQTSYGVYLNKRLLTKFPFRVDPEIVDTVYVNGDIILQDIVIEDYGVTLDGQKTLPDENTQVELGLPYYGLLSPKSFSAGMRLRIEGQVKMNPTYFVVNLLRGYKIWPYPTVALHFNPRYTGTVHVNAWYNGSWGREQRKQLDAGLLPGRNFSLIIVPGVSSYEVLVNKQPFLEFPFQTDLEIVDTVLVNGDIQLWDVVLEDNSSAVCEEKPSLQEFVETVPVYSNYKLGAIKTDLSFIVSGQILPHGDRFAINLILGTKTNDIALHVSPHLSKNFIVCNSRVRNIWGSAEVSSSLSYNLHRDARFTIQILISEAGYVISINGRHFTEFKHRLPYSSIAAIKVTGDVKNIDFNSIEADQYPECLQGRSGL